MLTCYVQSKFLSHVYQALGSSMLYAPIHRCRTSVRVVGDGQCWEAKSLDGI
jgi:hypothetical protein